MEANYYKIHITNHLDLPTNHLSRQFPTMTILRCRCVGTCIGADEWFYRFVHCTLVVLVGSCPRGLTCLT